jgi:anti-sigma regulatory factor (Ser/Thr protein kinase)
VPLSSQKIQLAADVASCAIARRFVEDALSRAPEDLRDDASLLLSEVFTNALLHGIGPVTIEVEQRGGGYRIAVGDRSSEPPVEKGYRVDDATGRGLHLLDNLAAAWGWDRTGFGKVVWFDLPVPLQTPTLHSVKRASRDDPYPEGTEIALLEAPVQEMIRTAAHYDAVYREFRLILELDPTRRQAIAGRLLGLIDELGTTFVGFGRSAEETWGAAVREGWEAVNIRFRLPPQSAFFLEHYDELLDEADSYCQRAELLTIAPTDEALAVRRWAFGQVVRQCRGQTPTPWPQARPFPSVVETSTAR